MYAQLGSLIATFMFVQAIFQQYFPTHLRTFVDSYFQKIFGFLNPYNEITFNEFTSERFMRSEGYPVVETYLSSISSAQARRFKGDIIKSSQSLVLTMDDNEEVADKFQGVKVWWTSGKIVSKTQNFSFQPVPAEEKRCFKLKFHQKHRELIRDSYLNHVLKEANAMKLKNRQRKLYTNSGSSWSFVPLEHPANFGTLAMEPQKKDELVNDLITFSKAEEYYSKIGRAWKRGYLLHGPPGTGKSTAVAAMANLLSYDIYDLELTAVKDNTELKKLLTATSSKSITLIEDIDCSVDLTGQRAKKREKKDIEENDPVQKFTKEESESESRNSKVTLSGLLNSIDGLWSACGGERLIVFTTNYVDKLDPALIRRGRMDKRFELSYCSFEAFKVLAKNYLNLESHYLFSRICSCLEEIKITPADVAEILMPKSLPVDAESCLQDLILALEGDNM